MSLEIPEKIKKLERYTKFGKMPQKTRKNASETSKKESGKILDIRKNTPEKLGKILPKKRDSGGNHFFHLWLHVACTAFNALQIYIINIRVHQNSKKFSKSHGLLIYFVPTLVQAISAKKRDSFLHFPRLATTLKKMARAQAKMR